jgi:hypothetical protein
MLYQIFTMIMATATTFIIVVLLTSCANLSLCITTHKDHSNNDISGAQPANTISECSGEFDFDCGPGELRQQHCISGYWMCDHVYDCTTGRVRTCIQKPYSVFLCMKYAFNFRMRTIANTYANVRSVSSRAAMATAFWRTNVATESRNALTAQMNGHASTPHLP